MLEWLEALRWHAQLAQVCPIVLNGIASPDDGGIGNIIILILLAGPLFWPGKLWEGTPDEDAHGAYICAPVTDDDLLGV